MMLGSLLKGACIGASIAAAVIFPSAHMELLKQNGTGSLPRGLYVRTWEPVEIGKLVFFPVPGSLRSRVRADVEGFLKPVVAMEGDTICLESRTFSVNGTPFAEVSKRLPNPSWNGCKLLSKDEVAVGSTRIPDSLDSRLYGAIPIASARVYRPLVTE